MEQQETNKEVLETNVTEKANELPQVTQKDVEKQVPEKHVSEALQIFGDNWRIATQLSKSTIIPESYRNKPENVIIALGMSQKMNIDPFTVMQNLNIVKGKTGWSGSFCGTLVEKSGKFKNINLVFEGKQGEDTYGCKVVATRKDDNTQVEGPLVNIKMAKEENWIVNKKWITMPQLMLSYRAMSFFARVYCPEALNGVYTSEEIEDIQSDNQPREIKDVLD